MSAAAASADAAEAAGAAALAESGPLEAPQEVRQDSQGGGGAPARRVTLVVPFCSEPDLLNLQALANKNIHLIR